MLREIDLTSQEKVETNPQRPPTLWVRLREVNQVHIAKINSICVSEFGLDKKPDFLPFNLTEFNEILNPPHIVEWRPKVYKRDEKGNKIQKKGNPGEGLDVVWLEGDGNQVFVRFKAVGRPSMNAESPDPRQVKAQNQIDNFLRSSLPEGTFTLEQIITHEIFIVPPVHVEENARINLTY